MSVVPLITRRKRAKLKRVLSLKFFYTISKREKLIFSALTLTTIVLLSAFSTALSTWLLLVVFAAISCVVLVLFSLWQDLRGVRFILIPIFPLLFTVGVILNLHIIPMHPVVSFILVAAYGVACYLVLLISNIITISAERTIPLMVAARAASYFFHLLIVFLLLFYLSTMKLHPLWLFIGALPLVAIPSYYMLWSFNTRAHIKHSLVQGTIIAYGIALLAFVLGLWPISPLFFALFLVAVYYVAAGVMHQEILNRLSRRVAFEYLAVLAFAALVITLTAQWGG